MQSITIVTFTKLCNHHHYITLKHFHHFSKKFHIYEEVTPFYSFPPAPATITFCLYTLPLLHLSYKWNYALCVASFVLLLLPCIMFSRPIHIVESISTLLLFIQEWDSIAWIHPFCLCTHPPMDTKVVSTWGYCEQHSHEHSCKSFCLSHSTFRCSF